MRLDREDKMMLAATIDNLLEIPRLSFSVETQPKRHDIARIKSCSSQIRNRLYSESKLKSAEAAFRPVDEIKTRAFCFTNDDVRAKILAGGFSRD